MADGPAASRLGHAYRRVVFYAWLALWLMETITHPDQLQAMTLWLNLQFILYFSISPSSTLEVGVLHTAVWGAMHSLGPGYLVMLKHITESGSLVEGFDALDGAMAKKFCSGAGWCAKGPKSTFTDGASALVGPFDCLPAWPYIRSLLLHFAPIGLLHLDLYLNGAELAATHAKLTSRLTRFYMVFVAPVWLALLHRDVFFTGAWTWKCARQNICLYFLPLPERDTDLSNHVAAPAGATFPSALHSVRVSVAEGARVRAAYPVEHMARVETDLAYLPIYLPICVTYLPANPPAYRGRARILYVCIR